jgi:hypothetical protein
MAEQRTEVGSQKSEQPKPPEVSGQAAPELPSEGGRWERLPDGTLRRMKED